jgi:tRNA (guanine-N7-)-methyltransferase
VFRAKTATMELPDDENVLKNGTLDPVPESDKGLRRYGVVAPRMPDGAIDLAAIIPGDTPLEIDIGFGRGLSVFKRAAVAPTWRLLGIEIKTKWAYKVEERRLREGLVNVRAYAGDARDILERATPSAYVERFYVHFPDPWWKRRHEHRTVVADRFLQSAARLLRDGGELFVQTDVKARMDEYVERMEEHPLFGPVRHLEDNPYGSVSGREAKAVVDELPIYRVVAARLPRDPNEVEEEE